MIPLLVRNQSSRVASRIPVSAGVPFARGALADPSHLSLTAADGKPVPLQTCVLSRWPDGSSRWVLVDLAADAPAESVSTYALSDRGARPLPEAPVVISRDRDCVTMCNGLITCRISLGSGSPVVSTSDTASSVEVVTSLEIGRRDHRVTSSATVERLRVYEQGPLRAAVSLYGHRSYTDGVESPWSQRIEMFAGWPYVRVEDTLVYAHFPGTHANPQNPLGRWALELSNAAGRPANIVSLMAPEEAEGLVVSNDFIAFWGKNEPLDMSRWTDELLVGEDAQGIALGTAKSCAALVGFPGSSAQRESARQLPAVFAHTTPEVYASSDVLAGFAPRIAGKSEKAEEGIRQTLGFWMFFQDHDPNGLWGRGPWHGLFDWGDWQVRYTDIDNQLAGWQYLEGRYGWDCNEMDTTLMLWSAFMHVADPAFWRAAVAMSRHTMDVDTIHVDYRKYSLPDYVYDSHHYDAPWREGDRLRDIGTIGMGRRHNVQHWGNGIGDTRHSWNGGVMIYYYLTGNRRAYDVALTIADMHMLRIPGHASGEYGLSLWCIYNAWQLTGDAKYLAELRYRLGVIQKLRLPNGDVPEHIDFNRAADYPEVDHGAGGGTGGIAFDYFSCALADYHHDTGDPVARELLLGLCELVLARPVNPSGRYHAVSHLRGVAWAWAQTGDNRFLERTRFWVETLSAEPLPEFPTTAAEWVEMTYPLLWRQAGQIRHIGPGIRMLPHALKALADAGGET